tara:strand:- start:1036 stop:1272 length:237 start_codon:yes stop_codon:yes gene_type:complete
MAHGRIYELRRQTFQDVLDDTPLLSLPIVFTGSAEQCKFYVETEETGFVWKDSPKMLFGGYWYKAPAKGENNECLLPT